MTKQKIMKAINSLLRPLGIEVVRVEATSGIFHLQEVHDPSSSHMKDKKLTSILINELSEISRTYFSDHLGNLAGNSFNFISEVEKFMTLYASRPSKENKGGSGFHNSFWLFLFARTLNPKLIIESGVWKGHTSWLLEQACPDATILGFDINLRNLEYKNGKVKFYEQDWSEYQFGSVEPEQSLVFFDCHVNHAKRILEAHDRGFRHLLFDDNPPVHKLYGYGLPGFPTANMVWKGLEVQRHEVAWYWQGKEISYQIDKKEITKARVIMKMHEVFPDVGGSTRYGGFSFLTYVKL